VTVNNLDVGLVSSSGTLVDFYAEVFELTELEAREFPTGVVRRLRCGPGALKVMIPAAEPATPAPTANFWDQVGVRYLTMWVDDVAAVVGRCRASAGRVALEPFEVRPGVAMALLIDPDGNSIEVVQGEG
jgi:predicted enzyme related to lactoylglutathione lyase